MSDHKNSTLSNGKAPNADVEEDDVQTLAVEAGQSPAVEAGQSLAVESGQSLAVEAGQSLANEAGQSPAVEDVQSPAIDSLSEPPSVLLSQVPVALREELAVRNPNKSIYIIRHAESTYNEWRQRSFRNFEWIYIRDPKLYDAPLSRKGEKQVKALRLQVEANGLFDKADLVVTSPLTRAIETTLGAFQGCKAPIIALGLHREQLDTACDVGTPKSVLQERYSDKGITFDYLDNEDWWRHDCYLPSVDSKVVVSEPIASVRRRLALFGEWLASRTEECIVVIGHSNFFKEMTGDMRKLRNCEVKRVKLRLQP